MNVHREAEGGLFAPFSHVEKSAASWGSSLAGRGRMMGRGEKKSLLHRRVEGRRNLAVLRGKGRKGNTLSSLSSQLSSLPFASDIWVAEKKGRGKNAFSWGCVMCADGTPFFPAASSTVCVYSMKRKCNAPLFSLSNEEKLFPFS